MWRALLSVGLVGWVVVVVGCGGSGEREKNKDFDRPTPAVGLDTKK